jgi:hypothetical protein
MAQAMQGVLHPVSSSASRRVGCFCLDTQKDVGCFCADKKDHAIDAPQQEMTAKELAARASLQATIEQAIEKLQAGFPTDLDRSCGLSPDDPSLAEIKINLRLMIAALERAETQPAPVACGQAAPQRRVTHDVATKLLRFASY